jgi:hypothetical protein
MPANGRERPHELISDLIEDDVPMPDNGGQFRRSAELLINQVEGRLIATSGNWGRILAVAADRVTWRTR